MPSATDGPIIDGYAAEDETALLAKLLKKFEEAEDAKYDERELATLSRALKDGDQWSAAERAILKKRGQPDTYDNVISEKIDTLMGLERRGRSDPKCSPRTPNEENRADVATQILRYITDDTRFDVIRSAVYANMLVEGIGAAEVIVEPDGDNDYRVVINQIPYSRLFYDPHSEHPGFTDASYIGMVIWMDREDAIDKYPGCESILSSTFEAGGSMAFDDKPHGVAWCDRGRQRVRVVQIWWKRREDWWCATFTKGGFLEPAMKSPYMDRRGVASCPIIMRSAKVGRNNERFGVVKDMIPLQYEINKRRSKLLHSLSVNQVIYEEGALSDGDVDRVRREVAKPDGVIKLNPGGKRFEIHKDQSEIAGQMQLLQMTMHSLDQKGPNQNLAGKDPREQSGRAIIAQQAGGQVQNEPMADELRQWTHKCLEKAWMCAKQFYPPEKVVRITDEEKDVSFVTVNHQVSLAEELQGMDPQKAQMIAQQMRLQPGDPRLQMIVRTEHDLDDLDVDITLDEGPDSPTMAAEQFGQIMSLPPMILQNFPPAFFIKASSLRNKEQLLAMLEDHQKQVAAAQAPQQQMQHAMAQAQLGKVQADTAKTAADAQKTQADTVTAGATAADKRAQAIERLHGVASEHADMAHQPVVPGVGAITPDLNPLLQPPPVQPQQGPTGP